jgi:hypothetical protein
MLKVMNEKEQALSQLAKAETFSASYIDEEFLIFFMKQTIYKELSEQNNIQGE